MDHNSPDLIHENLHDKIIDELEVFRPLLRQLRGTYKNTVCKSGSILELRVDTDGRRAQDRLSGDLYAQFYFCGKITFFLKSFVVENLTVAKSGNDVLISGPVKYYDDPSITNERIEVRIRRVNVFSPSAPACINWFKGGKLIKSYMCDKISEYFRTVELEIDRFQGTEFPPDAGTTTSPSPADIVDEQMSVRKIFERSGIDMTVIEDDVLNDPDSDDPGNNWSVTELHDLMEARYDAFANRRQWKTYGVVVPRFGDPGYSSGSYGVMFDWGGYQAGDTFLRQGAAIAEDATRGRASGTLYNSDAKKDRLVLSVFTHEIGHSFNLPHTWSRTDAPDAASESFMNYPWGYTGGGGESGFWSNFRWEFDDEELIWMRHGNRNDVIFGGNDWIGNNLSTFNTADAEQEATAISLELKTPDVVEFGAPLSVEVKLKNISSSPASIAGRLQPEDGLMNLFIQQPNGNVVQYQPPVRALNAPPEPTQLAPNETMFDSVMLSYGAKGALFKEPGEYTIYSILFCHVGGVILSKPHRFRLAFPKQRSTEELGHLLFSPEAAKFMYLGGTRRYPELTSKLEEATEKYAKTDPILVRHIHAALGKHYDRGYKYVGEKKGKRVVSCTKCDSAAAIKHMKASMQPLPDSNESALDNITLNKTTAQLANCYMRDGNLAEATKVLNQTMKYFEQKDVKKDVIASYKKQISSAKPSKKDKEKAEA